MKIKCINEISYLELRHSVLKMNRVKNKIDPTKFIVSESATMYSENFFTDNEEIQFFLTKRMDWEKMYSWLSDEDKEAIGASSSEEYQSSWFDALGSLGEICGGLLVKNAQAVDQSKIKFVDGQDVMCPELKENYETLKEFGIPALGVAPQYGGMGAPFHLEMVACELLNRACPSTMLNVGWYSSIAHIIETFGSQSIKDEYLPKIADGTWSGNMALTEPDAGSDLAALRTYGEKQEDGTWKLYGTKRFISNGTSQISLVLAKNEKGAQGLSALSLFLCPRILEGQDNIKVLKLEEKVGLHGSATVELAYDGSKAWLLGQEGEGFQYMLRLMNDSRIGVGFQGLGLMEATYKIAHQYAHERETWGKPIAKHELIEQELERLDVELKAIRSLCYQASYNGAMVYLGQKLLNDETLNEDVRGQIEKDVKSYSRRVRKWTPLIKYWVGEKSVVHARQALQILGGYGYTTEYKAEWWVRESLIYSLYEGTSQIQSLMCVKDVLKEVVRSPKSFIESALGLKIKSLTGVSPIRKQLNKIRYVSHNATLAILIKLFKANIKESLSAINDKEILKVIKVLSRDLVKFENVSPALYHAQRICEIKCIEHMSESLVHDAEEDADRTWIAEKFMKDGLLKVKYLKSQIDEL